MTVNALKPIAETDLLKIVKQTQNITGTHFDETLKIYIDEVKEYLKSAGVCHSENFDVIGSTLAVGCSARGVADLWNYGNGDTKFSDYFYQRADQLRCIKSTFEQGLENGAIITITQKEIDDCTECLDD